MRSLDSLRAEHEDFDFEVKAAQGRDGQGEVPGSLWESYSAMANTDGGVILLGVQEDHAGELHLVGIKNLAKVRKSLWDGLNNPKTISANLLREQDVVELEQDGLRLLAVVVPRATRTQRPIYVGPNPLTGTYRRNYEGDYRCDVETVRRMMAESVEEVRDARILPGYGMADLDAESLAAYRNEMKSTNPSHPFLSLDDLEFLRNVGGWGHDRRSNDAGLTLAGLLMFGRLHAILDAVPHYVVDYQERPRPPSDQRWVDRVTTDGTWSGNLFDFYRRVYRKLTSDLKVPFRLENGSKRIDEDHVHEALREALVNTLIHADFTDRISVLIVKLPGGFGFRNPGGLRLPVETVLRGGESDCRNRRLQKMFQLIGAAEQAGSGFPKILRAWTEQHWRYPLLDEKFQPDQTVLRLTTASQLPPEAMEELQARFGQVFRELSYTARLAVVTALVERKVTNHRLRMMTTSHPADLTALFKTLVHDGFLVPDGVGRGTSYRLPGETAEQPALALDEPSETTNESPVHSTTASQHLDDASVRSASASQHLDDTSVRSASASQHLDDTSVRSASASQHLDDTSVHSEDASQHLDDTSVHSTTASQHLDHASIHSAGASQHLEVRSHRLESDDTRSPGDSEQDPALVSVAAPIHATRNAPAETVRSTILRLCDGRYLSLRALAALLGRKPSTVQNHYINPMLRSNQLEYRYPDQISHPDQGYRTVRASEQNLETIS